MAIARALSSRHGLRVRSGAVILEAKHAILNTRLAVEVVEATPSGAVPRRAAMRWIAPFELGRVPTSGASAKIVRAVLAQRRSRNLRPSSSGSRGRAKA